MFQIINYNSYATHYLYQWWMQWKNHLVEIITTAINIIFNQRYQYCSIIITIIIIIINIVIIFIIIILTLLILV